jgi:hypothetical protein
VSGASASSSGGRINNCVAERALVELAFSRFQVETIPALLLFKESGIVEETPLGELNVVAIDDFLRGGFIRLKSHRINRITGRVNNCPPGMIALTLLRSVAGIVTNPVWRILIRHRIISLNRTWPYVSFIILENDFFGGGMASVLKKELVIDFLGQNDRSGQFYLDGRNPGTSKYPPAEPGALGGEPLKAAIGGATRPQ